MALLNIGWAETDITPKKRVSLYGQFAERVSEYVEKPLTATALAIENGEDQVIFCACDLEGIHEDLIADIRRDLEGNLYGLDGNKIIFSAIHTHCGPNHRSPDAKGPETGFTDGLKLILNEYFAPGQKYLESADISDPGIETPEEFYVLLRKQLYETVVKAWTARKPGGFANSFARAAVGMCRRAVYSDGTGQMWGDTGSAVFSEIEGGNDSGMELLYVFDGDGKPAGVVINLACPAQCVQHRPFVSPDFWGETKLLLRKHFGAAFFMLPLCSAAGDQCPVDLVRWVNPETDVHDPNIHRVNPPVRKADPSMFDLAGMQKAGRRIAAEVIDTFEEGPGPVQTEAVMEHRHCRMQLPLRRASLSQFRQAEQAVRTYIASKNGADVDFNDVACLQNDLGMMIRFREQETREIIEAETHFVRLGPVAFASNPFELFLDYGNQIRARANCEQTFLIQLACGNYDYLPTEKAEKHGHYSAFIPSGFVGHAGGEQLVRETLENINEMFGNDYRVYSYEDVQKKDRR